MTLSWREPEPIDQPVPWKVSYEMTRQWKETEPLGTWMVKTGLADSRNVELMGETDPKSELGW